jgi:CO/xanthine dehydrogenase FAD-binding subunit
MYEPVWQRPTTVSEALTVLDAERDRASLIAGGTDLVPRIRCGAVAPPVLVDIGRLEELRYVRGDDAVPGVDYAVTSPRRRTGLGALVTHAALARNDALTASAGTDFGLALLAAACARVGGPQIRARGSIGGNLANASPAADAATALLALDASVVVASRQAGVRDVPLSSFFVGPGVTSLGPDELVTGVTFERPGQDASVVYLKEGQRNALAIALVSVAVVLDRAAGRLRISLGSVAPTPIRAREAERLFDSEWERSKNRGALAKAVAEAAVGSGGGGGGGGAAAPIDDVRASAGYRRALVRVMVRRALMEAWT